MSAPMRSEAAGTLVGRLAARAAEEADRPVLAFLERGETESGRWSFGELDRRARAAAAAVAEVCAPGDRALLLHPPGLEFVAAFFGCLHAGVVAVPAYPPRSPRMVPRLRSMIADCRPAAALTTTAALGRLQVRVQGDPAFAAIPWVVTDGEAREAQGWRPRFEPKPEGLAFLQYTSGSTASPKGVEIRHGNLMHNQAVIREARGPVGRSVFVSWLPVYHDLGLIGQVLQAVYNGDFCVLMSPVAFLQRPARWLEAISRYRADASGGPDFAYDLCARKAADVDPGKVDLSCWRIAFNGAEPVRARTLERFAEAFAPLGFSRRAFLPCYGLAEATLMVSGGGPDELPVEVRLDAAALERGRAVAACHGGGARRLVACGRPLGGSEVQVVDPERRRPLPADRVGEIWVSSPSVARGYWGRDEDTAEAFGARLPRSARSFLRTGDLGFLHGGQLFVAGRIKDLIILRGRNHYPQDIELTAAESHPALVPGGSAAFSQEEVGDERLVVVQEVRPQVPHAPEELVAAIRQAVAEEHEARVARVVLVPAGSIPRTSSGKAQRRRCRDLLERGALPVLEAKRVGPKLADAAGRRSVPPAGPPGREGVERSLCTLVARLARVEDGVVDPRLPLTAYGLDSLAGVELIHEAEERLGLRLPSSLVLGGGSVRDALAAAVQSPAPQRAGREAAQPIRAEAAIPGEADGFLLPLSWGQRSLWFLHRLAPESTAYHLAGAARLLGGVDPDRLRRALQALVDRHPALRATYPEGAGGPSLRIQEPAPVAYLHLDVSGWDQAALATRLREEADRPFDLERGPVFRAALLSCNEDAFLVIAMHHVAADFWSLGLLARELGELYDDPGAGSYGLEARAAAYAGVARREARSLDGAEGERLFEHWRRRLEGAPALELPIDRTRPPVQTYRGGSSIARLTPGLTSRVKHLSTARGYTPFTLLLGAYASLLSRLSGQRDLLVGTPTAGRSAPDLASVVGFLVNTVALRFELADDPTAEVWVERVRQVLLEALEHAGMPLSLLAERLQPDRDPARPPLVQTLVALQRAPSPELQPLAAFSLGIGGARLKLGPLTLESVPLRRSGAQLDLALLAAELDGTFALAAEYNTDLFDATTVTRLLASYATQLEALTEALDPGRTAGSARHGSGARTLSGLPLLRPAERHQLTLEWSERYGARLPVQGRLVALIAGQLARAPDSVAVDAGEQAVSFAELDRRAARLAERLTALGAAPDVPVGVHVPHCPGLVVAVLAVLRAGAVYLPLDPNLPHARLATIVEEARPVVVVTAGIGVPEVAGVAYLSLDETGASAPAPVPPVPGPRPARVPELDHLAYWLFTSGSTGRPKGVGVSYRGLVNRLLRAQEVHALGPGDAVLHKAPIGFDFSLWEILAPLLAGARIVLARPGGHGDPAYLLEVVPRRRVTLVHSVPSLWQELALAPEEAGRLEGWRGTLRQAFSGGEALPAELAQRLLAQIRAPLENQYGPTEASIDVLWESVGPAHGSRRSVTLLGRPVAGCTVRILAAGLCPVPIGVADELCIGGVALARGYPGRPGLTASRFVPDPGPCPEPGGRLYRTGDLARYLADGRVEFLGRIDRQVKILGVRVEPAEVEAVLAAHPGVREAAVVAFGSRPGGVLLAAYWVAEPAAPAPEELREHVAARVPRVMVPAHWIEMAGLPRTATGKLDRRGLPPPKGEGRAPEPEGPRTVVEELVAELWADLLGTERVGRGDDFFALGGHSLLAARLVSRLGAALGVEVPLSAVFVRPTVAALAELVARLRSGIGSAEGAVPPRLTPRREGGSAPLSYAQEGLWFLDRAAPGSPVYNMPAVLRLSGELDVGALRRSLEAIVHRHEVLRSRFHERDGTAVQSVAPAAPLRLPVVDLTGGSALVGDAGRRELDRLARDEALGAFALGSGPPLRVRLVRRGPREHALLMTVHHIVGDGWSVAVLVRELEAAYKRATAGAAPDLPALPVQYADFAAWQRRWLSGPVLERWIASRRDRLAGAPRVLALPTDRPRPTVQSFRGAAEPLDLGPELSGALAVLARRRGVTPFMALLAPFQALLARWSGAEDLCVGVPVANRRPVETESLIGLFANLLVLRAELTEEPRWTELLERTRREALDAFDHQELPFERLVDELAPERSLSCPPLVQVTFGLGEQALSRLVLGAVTVEVRPRAARTAKFDLSVSLEATEGGFRGEIDYARDLFDAATIRRMARQYRVLAELAVSGPDARIADASPLAGPERHQLLAEWGRGSTPRLDPATVLDRIEAWFADAPDAVALTWAGGSMTYGELDRRSRELGRRLAGLGLGPEGLVALLTGRSPELVLGALAALRAGGAYLPLDPSHPPARIESILEGTGVAVLMVRAGLERTVSWRGAPELVLDAGAAPGGAGLETAAPALQPAIDPERLAYVIFTSGSTGRPKGIEVAHRGLVRLAAWYERVFVPRSGERVTQVAGPAFDASVKEIWPSLWAGCCIDIPPEDVRTSPEAMMEHFASRRIAVAFLPTPLAELALEAAEAEAGPAAGPRVLLTGGERLHRRPRRKLAFVLYNLYGPAEATVVTTAARVDPADGPPSLGRPIDRFRVRLLDRASRLVPAGVPGELCIGGPGLARGYRRRPALTAECFGPDPFTTCGGRLYRSGDLARFLPSGELEFLGRFDDQIKIRGFRTELGEIEVLLAAHPAIVQAAVTPPAPDRPFAAYVVAAPGPRELDPGELRGWLERRLPHAMVPERFVVVPVLPITANGKVDRSALPDPGPPGAETASTPPRGPLEEIVAAAWSEILGVDGVGAHDDLFLLGGNSLLAIRILAHLRAVTGVDVPVRELFERPTVAGLAAALERSEGACGAPEPELRPVARSRPLPASFAQQRLWFLARLAPGSTAYNLPAVLDLAGPLATAAFAAALRGVVARHEVLRTRFEELDGAPVQVISEARPVPLPVVDLAALPGNAGAAEAARIAAAESRRPFDLAQGPMLRATLLRLGRELHEALVSTHHVAADGWSLAVFVRELGALYRVAAGRPAALHELPVQYADFAVWERRRLSPERLDAGIRHFRERLRGLPAGIDLPIDGARSGSAPRGAHLPVTVDPELAEAVRSLAHRCRTTGFVVLLAGLRTLLGRHAGQEDFAVGVPVADRARPELEGLIGFFVNTLALRTDLGGDPAFEELLARERETCLDGFAHRDVPYGKVVEALALDRGAFSPPLCEILFGVQNVPRPEGELAPGLALRVTGGAGREAKLPLVLLLSPAGGGFTGTLEYAADLFDEATARALLERFGVLLRAAVKAPGKRLSELPLLSPSERRQVTEEWNRTAAPFPRDATVHGLFRERAAGTPDAVAVELGGEHVSYRELDRRSDRLARRLLDRLGAGGAAALAPEAPVALLVPRSVELVLAILGVLKAGAAYLPLAPDDPPARLELLLRDAGCSVLIASAGAPAPADRDGLRILPMAEVAGPSRGAAGREAPPPSAGAPSSLAYVMYTSGSTGRPKGVEVSHRAVVRLVCGTDYARLGPEESSLLLAPASFDASTFELWGALLHSARLVVMPPGPVSLGQIARVVEARRITSLWLTAGLFHQLAETELPVAGARWRGLRQLLAGGDVLSPRAVQRALASLPETAILNGYGPTEGTTFTCCHRARPEDAEAARVPIGSPIANTRVHVVDRDLQAVPPGVAGELVAAGEGLARGYRGRPGPTAERFVPDPFAPPETPGGRLYRTGDRVRWRRDGVIEFLGRLDRQIKIRGFRVEPEEVEEVLAAAPDVAQVAVTVDRGAGGGPRLVAWVEPAADRPLDPRTLSAYLGERLPAYMRPDAYRVLEALPLTANGKIDRRRLLGVPLAAAPEEERGAAPEAGTAPRGPVQQLVAALWAELLGLDWIGARDDFFELGGHSLLATRLVSRLRGVFGVELPLAALFEAPTVEGMAAAVERLRRSAAPAAPPLRRAVRGVAVPLSFAQERLWFLDRLQPASPAYNVPAAVRLTGSLDHRAFARALRAVVDRHEALRTRFIERQGAPVQEVLTRRDPPVAVIDLGGLPPSRAPVVATGILQAEVTRGFDLAHEPLVRLSLVRLAPRDRLAVLTLHHIATDGWSVGVLIEELTALYAAFRRGAGVVGAELPPLPIQYPDFAIWQRGWLRGEVLAAEVDHWRERLAGAPEILELPADRPRPAIRGQRGRHLLLHLGPDVTAGLEALGRGRGATLFMALLALFVTLLHRYTGLEDLLVGTPVANRRREELEPLIGFFVNTLVLRGRPRAERPFARLLEEIREEALVAYEHQDLPFEKLVEELRPDRSLAHAPLVQVMIALESTPGKPLLLPEVEVRPQAVEVRAAKLDLTLLLRRTAGGIEGGIEYDRDLFDPTTILRLAGHFTSLASMAIARPEAPLGDLDLLTPEERHQLASWNDTADPVPARAAVQEWIAARSREAPDSVAIVADGGRTLSYGALDERARGLALRLRELGVGPEARVAVLLERSADLPVALLAVLLAGGAYVPLDPEEPPVRLGACAAEAGARWVVTAAAPGSALAGWEGRSVPVGGGAPSDRAQGSAPSPAPGDALAYVLFTSGSTGRPKGVQVTHRALANQIRWFLRAYPLGASDRLLQKTSIAFDASVWEIFVPLAAGAVLVMARPGGQREPGYIARRMERERVTLLQAVPALWRVLLDDGQLAGCRSLRTLFSGGEALPRDLQELLVRVPDCRTVNLYGPAEATVQVTSWVCDDGRGRQPAALLGRPIDNARIHVAGPGLSACPAGVPGELCVAGSPLARGYASRPGLTAARFVPDRWGGEPGARLYRTGDRGRWLADGRLEYLGRLDHQLKIRGHRVEPGEVEAVLRSHRRVVEAVVVASGDGDRARLWAYVIPGPEGASDPGDLAGELSAFLAPRLPGPMIPSGFVVLDRLPLLPTGKLDRSRLPPPRQSGGTEGYVAPRNEIETLLAGAVAELLELDQVGIEDDFFALGGHSLLGIRLLSKVRDAFGVELGIRALFEAPTVAGLAVRVVERIVATADAGAAAEALAEIERERAFGDRHRKLA